MRSQNHSMSVTSHKMKMKMKKKKKKIGVGDSSRSGDGDGCGSSSGSSGSSGSYSNSSRSSSSSSRSGSIRVHSRSSAPSSSSPRNPRPPYFYIHQFRTALCPEGSKGFVCSKSEPYTCGFAHGAEVLRRKPFRDGQLAYSSELCQHESLLECSEACPFSHASQREHQYHPDIFRCSLCTSKKNSKGVCRANGIHCHLAHHAWELRTKASGLVPCTSGRNSPASSAESNVGVATVTGSNTSAISRWPNVSRNASDGGGGDVVPNVSPNSIWRGRDPSSGRGSPSVTCGDDANDARELDALSARAIRARHQLYMFKFRTMMCPKPGCTVQSCTYFHPYNMQAHRRVPYYRGVQGTWNYLPTRCRTQGGGMCSSGDTCKFSHTTEEVVYHPMIYKTKSCEHVLNSQGVCTGRGVHCAKAHGPRDLRSGDMFQDIPPEFFVKTTTGVPSAVVAAARAIAKANLNRNCDHVVSSKDIHIHRHSPGIPGTSVKDGNSTRSTDVATHTPVRAAWGGADGSRTGVAVVTAAAAAAAAASAVEDSAAASGLPPTDPQNQNSIYDETLRRILNKPYHPRVGARQLMIARHYLLSYKTKSCSQSGCTCDDFHEPRERRRLPHVVRYSPIPCCHVFNRNASGFESWSDPGLCPDGDACKFAHSIHETMYHPALYKTRICIPAETTGCAWKKACVFAHGNDQLQPLEKKILELMRHVVGSPSVQVPLDPKQVNCVHPSFAMYKSPRRFRSVLASIIVDIRNEQTGTGRDTQTAESSSAAFTGKAALNESSSVRAPANASRNPVLGGEPSPGTAPLSLDARRSCIVLLRGLPWKTTAAQIAAFLGNLGGNGLVPEKRISIPLDVQKRPKGHAFVQLDSPQQVAMALRMHKRHLGPRYIEISRSTPRKRNESMKWTPGWDASSRYLDSLAVAAAQHVASTSQNGQSAADIVASARGSRAVNFEGKFEESPLQDDVSTNGKSNLSVVCELCRLQLASAKQRTEHERGARHRANLARADRLKNKMKSTEVSNSLQLQQQQLPAAELSESRHGQLWAAGSQAPSSHHQRTSRFEMSRQQFVEGAPSFEQGGGSSSVSPSVAPVPISGSRHRFNAARSRDHSPGIVGSVSPLVGSVPVVLNGTNESSGFPIGPTTDRAQRNVSPLAAVFGGAHPFALNGPSALLASGPSTPQRAWPAIRRPIQPSVSSQEVSPVLTSGSSDSMLESSFESGNSSFASTKYGGGSGGDGSDVANTAWGSSNGGSNAAVVGAGSNFAPVTFGSGSALWGPVVQKAPSNRSPGFGSLAIGNPYGSAFSTPLAAKTTSNAASPSFCSSGSITPASATISGAQNGGGDGFSMRPDGSDEMFDILSGQFQRETAVRYCELLRANEIDVEALRVMNDANLASLGVPLGHRMKILNAVPKLRDHSRSEDANENRPNWLHARSASTHQF